VLLALAGGAAAAASSPKVTVESRSGVYEVRGSFSTGAPIDTAWAVLTDYGGISSFVSSIQKSEVERRSDEDLRVLQVATVGHFPFRLTARVTLVVHEEPRRHIAFADVSGQDFRTYVGSWTLRTDSDETVVAYVLDAAPGSGPPGWIARGGMRHTISEMLGEVRAEIERRAARR
jgi:carbon monoxide dehydrogenase subunit G